tara:strand:+ start:528 stop:674 length:147 start_codon:yes stop_codon:yes gene_type:complete
MLGAPSLNQKAPASPVPLIRLALKTQSADKHYVWQSDRVMFFEEALPG